MPVDGRYRRQVAFLVRILPLCDGEMFCPVGVDRPIAPGFCEHACKISPVKIRILTGAMINMLSRLKFRQAN